MSVDAPSTHPGRPLRRAMVDVWAAFTSRYHDPNLFSLVIIVETVSTERSRLPKEQRPSCPWVQYVAWALMLSLALPVNFAASGQGAALSQEEPATRDELYERAANPRWDFERASWDFEGAIRDLDEALRVRPDWVDAYILRGLAHFNFGAAAFRPAKFEAAIEDFTRALAIDPITVEALGGRANRTHFPGYVQGHRRRQDGGGRGLRGRRGRRDSSGGNRLDNGPGLLDARTRPPETVRHCCYRVADAIASARP